jgi:hypothetical protein
MNQPGGEPRLFSLPEAEFRGTAWFTYDLTDPGGKSAISTSQVQGDMYLKQRGIVVGRPVVTYFASSTISVESVARDVEFAGGEVEHGQQVFGGSVAPSLRLVAEKKLFNPSR